MPASILRKLFIRIIVYLENFLILGEALEETILKQGYCGLPVTESRFCHKPKEIIHPTQKIAFLGIIIDSVEMTMSLPREKVQSIFKRCLDILSKQVSIKDLGKLLGAFSSTALAILPALLYMRFLEELNWWISNLRLLNGRSVRSHQVKRLIQPDA